ncbi:protein STRUBBELIG-RECEPTOR FAMILY 2-like [Papaver somniferum]|uniref:protein STRUBBELIG-RECEPTOR FAMILY 2-like n=1 Tax=Papaver somniferum TaxID=3469 RepID=UPI000E701DAF|nr:protein STRUBBELIG-RECEPTOR FAMILY 2-like [Papaver somniferum]
MNFFWRGRFLVLYDVKKQVTILQDLYKSLNQPPQLDGWKLNGGDPCKESWKGISCSGSSVMFIKINGLELNGSLGGNLFGLFNLKQLDVSFNHIEGEIPSSLPPNATHIDLSFNNFNQNIPFSLTSMKYLRHLNISHNSLSGPVGNVFMGLPHLKQMDLSYNNFTGDLPRSFGSLKNLTGLFLQNNQFTGSVVFLAYLPLTDLDIRNNHFSGVIPKQFEKIPHLWFSENAFQITPTPREGKQKQKGLAPGAIAFTVGGVFVVAICVAALLAMRSRLRRNNRNHATVSTATGEGSIRPKDDIELPAVVQEEGNINHPQPGPAQAQQVNVAPFNGHNVGQGGACAGAGGGGGEDKFTPIMRLVEDQCPRCGKESRVGLEAIFDVPCVRYQLLWLDCGYRWTRNA